MQAKKLKRSFSLLDAVESIMVITSLIDNNNYFFMKHKSVIKKTI